MWHLDSIDDSLQEDYSGQFFELENVEVVLRHVHHRNEVVRSLLREQGTFIITRGSTRKVSKCFSDPLVHVKVSLKFY